MKNDIKAMITLLDDTDSEVVSLIETQLKNIGPEVIPDLENEWKNYGLNPIIQKKIEDLIHEMQFNNLKSELFNWVSNDHNDLLKGLWLIAKYQFPDLSYEGLKSKIEEIYIKIYIELHDQMHPKDVIKKINYVIFEEFKFESNIKNFHSPSNSMINLVIEQRKGNPVALSCIFILVAKKLNLPIYGVNLPNLFILIFDYPGYKFYINAFNKGQIFSVNDIKDYLNQLKIEHEEKYFNACSNLEIIKRILTNLSFAYNKLGEETKQEEINQLLEILAQRTI